MTRSAPSERDCSTFRALHTAVTSAPKTLASCTAKVPTPPDAPFTRTRSPGLEVAFAAQALDGRHAGQRCRRGLAEADVGGFVSEHALRGAGQLGEGAPAGAAQLSHHGVTGLEACH